MESDGVIGLSDPWCGPSGAIFMANRSTMKECLRWKIFGLPFNFGDFVKKIKAGMILFLFEYEEKKLYGVFEAACNGALNIIPHAFSSSGKSFPAQLRIKRLWHCHPLTEKEFYFAIKENYYTPKKFNSSLSEKQVSNLLQLFDSRKKRVQKSLNSELHTDTVVGVEELIPSRVELTVDQRILSPKIEHNKETDVKSMKYQWCCHPNPNEPVGYSEPLLGRDDSLFGIRFASHPTSCHAHSSQDREIMSSQSQRDHTFFRNGLGNPLRHSYSSYRIPSFQHQQPSSSFDAALSSVQAFTAVTNDEVVGHHSQNHLHRSHQDPVSVPSTDYLPMGVSCSPEAYTVLFSSIQEPTSSQLSLSNYRTLRGRPGFTDLESYYGQSVFDPYVPATSANLVKLENFGRLQADSSFSIDHSGRLLSQSPQTLQFEDNSRGQRYWDPVDKDSPLFVVEDFDMNTNLSNPNENSLDEKYSCNLKTDDGFDNEWVDYSRPDSDCYLTDVNTSAKLDTCHGRTSVFSRLSMGNNAQRSVGSFVVDLDHLSVDQVMSRLAKQKVNWRKNEASNRRIAVGGRQPHDNIHLKTEGSKRRASVVRRQLHVNVPVKNEASIHRTAVGERQQSVNIQVELSQGSVSENEGSSCNDTVKKECSKQLSVNIKRMNVTQEVGKGQETRGGVFVNFKRRSETQKFGKGQEIRGGECSSEKQKRRKLIRPSFCYDLSHGNENCRVKQSFGGASYCTFVKDSAEKGTTSVSINHVRGDASSNYDIEESFQRPIEGTTLLYEKCSAQSGVIMTDSLATPSFEKVEFNRQNLEGSCQQSFEGLGLIESVEESNTDNDSKAFRKNIDGGNSCVEMLPNMQTSPVSIKDEIIKEVDFLGYDEPPFSGSTD